MFLREITEEELIYIFELMGSRIRKGRGNFYGSCPIAHHTHQKGRDKSKGLTAWAKGPGTYNCHGCNIHGPLFQLTRLYGQYERDLRPHDELNRILDITDYIPEKIEYGDRKKGIVSKMLAQAKDQDFLVTEEIFQEKFLKHVHLDYLKSRGVGEKQILRWEIGFDPRENRVIFPVREWGTRELIGVSGRSVLPDGDPKWKHYVGMKKDRVLYGEHLLDVNETRAYVVEGFFDVLRLRGLGLKNVVASMGTSLSDQQRKKLCNYFKEVVFVPDFDDAGMGLRFVEEITPQVKIEGKNLDRVGIAGVRQNKEYLFRHPKPPKWENTDFRFLPVDDLLGLDPGDFKSEHVSIALSHIQWV